MRRESEMVTWRWLVVVGVHSLALLTFSGTFNVVAAEMAASTHIGGKFLYKLDGIEIRLADLKWPTHLVPYLSAFGVNDLAVS